MSLSTDPDQSSIWRVFTYPTFSAMWAGMVLFNLGIWLNEIAAGWLMTSMTSEPIYVAMLQFCLNLPIFLLALPAGWLGDRVNRRDLLLVIQLALIAILSILVFLVLNDLITPVSLLFFTALTGAAVAVSSPARQATWTMIVPPAQRRSALALAAIGFNGSRTVGPTLGGIAVASFGAGYAYLCHVIGLLIVTVIVFFWRAEPPAPRAQGSNMISDIVASLRYLKGDEVLLRCTLRLLFFMLTASVLWVLLPLIGRALSEGNAIIYSLCVASVGAGSIIGGFPVPKIQRRHGTEPLLASGSALGAFALLVLGISDQLLVSLVATFAFGVGWIFVTAAIGVTIQLSVRDEFRARILSISLVSFAAAGMIGALIWGALASVFGVAACLAVGAVSMGLLYLAGRRFLPVRS